MRAASPREVYWNVAGGKAQRGPPQSASSNSASSCCCRRRRAAFLIARRSAATACFSAWRSLRVRVSTDFGKCTIFGRRAPTFRSFGFAYGSIKNLALPGRDKKDEQRGKLKRFVNSCSFESRGNEDSIRDSQSKIVNRNKMWAVKGSNLRPTGCKPAALPLS